MGLGFAQMLVLPPISGTLVASFPAEFRGALTLVPSPDLRRMALIEPLTPSSSTMFGEQPLVFVLDGHRSEPYHFVDSLFSPDSKRVAYTAGIQKPRYRDIAVVVDDRVDRGPYRDVLGLAFSSDSQRVAYAAVDPNQNSWVVIDGQRYGPYDEIRNEASTSVWGKDSRRVIPFLFSVDSPRLAYAARRGRDWRVYVDGAPASAEAYRDVRRVVLSPDGKRVAYEVREGSRERFVRLDNSASGPYDEVSSLDFSHDSAHFGYAARSGRRWRIVVDGRPSDPYEEVREFRFGPNASQASFTAKIDGKWRIVVAGRASEPYDDVAADGPTFSPTGERHAFAGRIGRSWWAVVDGIREGPYDEVKPVASRHGRPVRFVFSSDGSSVAYVARVGRAFHVVRDGRRSPAYSDVVALALSPDGRHVVYRASRPDAPMSALTLTGFPVLNVRMSAWLVVVDETNSIIEDGAEGWIADTAFVFDSPEEFHWIAIRYPYGAYVIRHLIQ